VNDAALVILALIWLLGIPVIAIIAFVFAYQSRKKVALIFQTLEASRAEIQALKTYIETETSGKNSKPFYRDYSRKTEADKQSVSSQPVKEPNHSEAYKRTFEDIRAPEDSISTEDKDGYSDIPKQSRSGEELESRFGGKWSVFVGGFAIALGAIFMVRYTIEEGLLSPAMRVLFGILTALVLLAAGEVLRRKKTEETKNYSFAKADVPSILTGCGIIALFAAILASYTLYGLISDIVAFISLAATALIALVLAALHGPILAALGLVGSFVTPVLISSTDPSAWGLIMYLIFVFAAVCILSTWRQWPWLIYFGVGAITIWSFMLITLDLAAASFLPALAITMLVATLAQPDSFHDYKDGRTNRPLALIIGILGLTLLLFSLMSQSMEGLPGLLLAAGVTLLCGLYYPALRWGYIACAMFVLAAFADWTAVLPVDAIAGGFLPDEMRRSSTRDPAFTTLLSSGFLISVLILVASIWLGRYRMISAPRNVAVAAVAASMVAIGIIVLSYWRVGNLEPNIFFATGSLVLAAVFAAITEHFVKLEEQLDLPQRSITGIFGIAGLAATAIALSMILREGWLILGFSLICLSAAWVGKSRAVLGLRRSTGFMGLVSMVTTLALLISGQVPDVGSLPFLNGLIPAFGLPSLIFFFCARIFLKRQDDVVVYLFELLSIVFWLLFVIFEIRHAFHGPAFLEQEAGIAELGLIVSVLALTALVLFFLGRTQERIAVTLAANLICGLSAFASLGLILANPYWTGAPVGQTVLFNQLAPGYLLPCISFAAILAMKFLPFWLSRLIASLCVLLFLMFATLTVRQVFQGNILSGAFVSERELYGYSAAWLLSGVVLLSFGFLTHSKILRGVSGVILAGTVLKVFLIDMAQLEGILRAASFLGLGAVLVGIGWFYQRHLMASSKTKKEVKV
jgi:uncharacterized membrane protein